ncbi:DUF5777 family beta-barrel protein [Flavitalea sp. BT771]|uniref:DUF5777 family beta-barrel protein n=1 Tax=Flavitalea sp. BT771 TaxID=3063329 RepID=UPI0026E44C64|nr:DUF5777 family beta-barrel protein [Flavitalea sp. BT771]MDO6432873.1 DUF5777 family beta-barrel protein [Flavitalea sp. BT771]MDV6221851.1 DUF5777 family beta-barrel protein [Flavitalea sp. BT771]
MKQAILTAILLSSLFFAGQSRLLAQQQDLLSLVEDKTPKKEHVTNAFKSTRVIDGQSMEFLGKGVLDTRILHRFGLVNSGARNLYGLDQANMRLGFDYGLLNSVMIGIGRSNVNKEIDGFLKLRPIWQSTGPHAWPLSVVLVTSMTLTTAPWSDTTRKNFYSSRLSYYNAIILGRKFSERFSLQLTPEMVHRNLVSLTEDHNDVFALGIGARFKLSRRTAFVVDYHHIISGLRPGTYQDPLAIGFDIETGGHVFQLHFSNSLGMNERAFLTETTDNFGKGAIRFGFNLSRVFTVHGKKSLDRR